MKHEPLNNESLLVALKSNRIEQDRAIRQLCFDPKIKGAVFNFIKQYNLGREMGDDVLQDALIILIKSIRSGSFQQKSEVSTFLIGIVRRLCQQKFRENQKTTYAEPENMVIKESTDSREMALVQLESEKEYAMIKRKLFAQLSEKCRTILLMAANGYSREEIAEEMGWTNVQTAKNSVPECRQRLRKMIEENHETMNIIKSRI
ncbi:MAG: sigma-70 family RNA polymerase sigma factor [Saprospiraceae bacterium]